MRLDSGHIPYVLAYIFSERVIVYKLRSSEAVNRVECHNTDESMIN